MERQSLPATTSTNLEQLSFPVQEMAGLSATWRQLTTSPILERSSQTVSVINDKVYIFGGELQPREPRDNNVHILNLNDGKSLFRLHFDESCHRLSDYVRAGLLTPTHPCTVPKAAVATLPSSFNSPTARVGSASTTLRGKMFLFSGRGGVAMTCLEEKGSLWVFDPATSDWSIMSPIDPALPYPEARSYHALGSDGEETLYLHAGCPATGRLSDLWSFHITSKRWTRLSSAPEPARGGTSIAYSGGQLYRMHGFDGKAEQGGNIDIYDVKARTWTAFSFNPDGISGPGSRSVSCLLAIDINHRPSLVAMFGERDPSSLGHEGAGKMLGDVWVCDILSRRWTEVKAVPGGEPEARGWFDADVTRRSGKEEIVVHGGLNSANERLGDVWLLEVK